ncbi:hypothetical protein D3C86_1420210 [compost metagenome]
MGIPGHMFFYVLFIGMVVFTMTDYTQFPFYQAPDRQINIHHLHDISTWLDFTHTKERVTIFFKPRDVGNVDINTKHLGVPSAIDLEHLLFRDKRQFAFFKPLLDFLGFHFSGAVNSHRTIRETNQCYGVQINITHLD